MNKFTFKLFLLSQLPIGFVAGMRLVECTANECKIALKLGFWNKNPFKSIFWAVQGMAAEMSTALLAFEKIRKSKKSVAMLVIEQDARFLKKATGKVIYTCKQGDELGRVLQKAIETGLPETIKMYSTGVDEAGDVVAEFSFTWSFKCRN